MTTQHLLSKSSMSRSSNSSPSWHLRGDNGTALLYFLLHIIRVIKSRRTQWAGNVACIRVMINAFQILFNKSKGKTPLGRRRHEWKDDIKISLKETGYEGVDWLRLVQDGPVEALVNTEMNFMLGSFLLAEKVLDSLKCSVPWN